jgi:hypothetical protein
MDGLTIRLNSRLAEADLLARGGFPKQPSRCPHLRWVLKSYARYHNDVRTHRSLEKDARSLG